MDTNFHFEKNLDEWFTQDLTRETVASVVMQLLEPLEVLGPLLSKIQYFYSKVCRIGPLANESSVLNAEMKAEFKDLLLKMMSFSQFSLPSHVGSTDGDIGYMHGTVDNKEADNEEVDRKMVNSKEVDNEEVNTEEVDNEEVDGDGVDNEEVVKCEVNKAVGKTRKNLDGGQDASYESTYAGGDDGQDWQKLTWKLSKKNSPDKTVQQPFHRNRIKMSKLDSVGTREDVRMKMEEGDPHRYESRYVKNGRPLSVERHRSNPTYLEGNQGKKDINEL